MNEQFEPKSFPVTGVILAGGNGTRLMPLTRSTSKQLLPIGGKSLVERVIDQFVSAGIKDLVLLIDQRYASDFMAVAKDGRELGLRSLVYAWQPAEANGLPSAIGQVENIIHNDKFIVACGDVLVDADLEPSIRAFMSQPTGARIVTTPVSDTAGYTPVTGEDNLVLELGAKDKNRHKPGNIDLGMYMYHHDVFQKIRELKPSDRGETEIWDLNNKYVAHKELYSSIIEGWWSDIGTSMEVYREAHDRYVGK